MVWTHRAGFSRCGGWDKTDHGTKSWPSVGGQGRGAALRQFHGGAFVMLNDADAVAVAEAEHGVGHDEHDCVLTLTVGTGLGTTVHRQGTMIPNLEYGRLPHPRLKGCLEEHLSGASRTHHGWDLKTWASHFQEGLTYLEEMVQPGRIVLYGGIMEHWSSIQPLLRTEAELVAAVLTETAGPLGAALSATRLLSLCERPPVKTSDHLHRLAVLDFPEVFLGLTVGDDAEAVVAPRFVRRFRWCL